MNSAKKRAMCTREAATLLPRLHDYVAHHAAQRPRDLALIEHETGATVSWSALSRAVDAFAAKLLAMGLEKGDVVATTLPFMKEHVYLEYACFKIGVIVAPLDLRLRTSEILEAFAKVRPKAYFFLGVTPKMDFRPMVAEVMKHTTGCQHWIQFQLGADGVLPGAQHAKAFAKDIPWRYLLSLATGTVRRAARQVDRRDPALIIFTTGSTGAPKPALLCHENILLQNAATAISFDLTAADRMMVNLPTSHVGGQTEQLMTSIYGGGPAVLLHIFDAEKTLEAIAAHRVTILGQIPALFAIGCRWPG